jgi:hypothetical protein
MNGFRAYLPVLVITISAAALGAAPASAADGLPLPANPSASDGLRDLLATTAPGRARKGLGLPGYNDLLGRGWKAKAAKADAELIADLDAVAGAAPRARRAESASDYNGADPLGVGDSIKGRGGKQTRRFRFQAAVDPCPVIGTSYVEDGVFEVRGDFRAEYEVTTVERVGKHDVTTNVVLDMRGQTSSQTNLDATLSGIGARDVTVSVTRSQRATNRKTGKTKSTGPVQTYSQPLSTIWVREGNFEEFIAQQDGDEAPAPKRVLRSSAWDDAVDKFINMGFLPLAGAYATTEKRATTPGVCMELTLEAPETLAPGQTTPITGHPVTTHATATKKQILVQGFGAKAEYVNNQGQTAVLRPDYNPGWSEGRPWYDFTAPDDAWPASSPIGLKVILTTGAGVDEATVFFKPAEDTLYYRVVNATVSYHTTASAPSTLCGTESGSKSFDGEFAETDFDPENAITLEDGRLTGEVQGRVHGRWHSHHLEGCKSGPGGRVPCVTDMPDRTPGLDGTKPVSFSVANGANPGEARLNWGMDDPEVGFVDAGDDECNVHVWSYFPQEIQHRTVSLDTLRSTEPITLEFNGTGHLDHDNYGDPASIDHTWSYSLTIQRVAADGQPLG